MQGDIPSPPTEPPDEAALSYFAIVGDSIASQIAEARINGLKVPAYLLLPPPPRPCDLQLIQSFIPYLFANTYEGAAIPEIRFITIESDAVH
jgi:hypothetical protein